MSHLWQNWNFESGFTARFQSLTGFLLLLSLATSSPTKNGRCSEIDDIDEIYCGDIMIVEVDIDVEIVMLEISISMAKL